MVMRQSQRWCGTCARMTLHGQEQTSGCAVIAAVILVPLVLGLIHPAIGGTVFILMLIALPIMGMLDVLRRHRCQVCGAKGGTKRPPAGAGVTAPAATVETTTATTTINREPVPVDPAQVQRVWRDAQEVEAARRLDHPPTVVGADTSNIIRKGNLR